MKKESASCDLCVILHFLFFFRRGQREECDVSCHNKLPHNAHLTNFLKFFFFENSLNRLDPRKREKAVV